jgi:mannosyltransferase OCH1-like enzyme
MRIAQYFILYHCGGVFVDAGIKANVPNNNLDTRCIRNIEPLIKNNKMFVAREPPKHCQDYEMEDLLGVHIMGCIKVNDPYA